MKKMLFVLAACSLSLFAKAQNYVISNAITGQNFMVTLHCDDPNGNPCADTWYLTTGSSAFPNPPITGPISDLISGGCSGCTTPTTGSGYTFTSIDVEFVGQPATSVNVGSGCALTPAYGTVTSGKTSYSIDWLPNISSGDINVNIH